MTGETNLKVLLKTLKPVLNQGDFAFCTIKDLSKVSLQEILYFFREAEGLTIIVKKEYADRLNLEYSFVATWITLSVHSSLQAVGLTAAFSRALARQGISCNVVAACHHDHIFVDKKDALRAVEVLSRLSGQTES